LPIAIDTDSWRAISVSLTIRSRNAVSDAAARPGKARRSSPRTSRAHSELADSAGLRPAASSGRASRNESSSSAGSWSTASMTPLPMPRAGTLITRRRLTSSCGLMIRRM
jgi:hypothetical protein